jgi:hypothetical protein
MGMFSPLHVFFSGIRLVTFLQWLSFFLGLTLVTAVPYSAGLAKNWFIPLAEGYQISFFYLVEMLLVAGGVLYYGIRFTSRAENFVFLSLGFIILSRIISLLFAETYEVIQFISVMRYVEVLLVLYVLTRIFGETSHRNAFVAGLAISVLVESVMGFIKFVASGGTQRGIFIGVGAYQLATLLVLFLLLVSVYEKQKWKPVLLIAIFLLGIVATLTRSALFQFGLALIPVYIWAYLKRELKPMLLVLIASTGLAFGISLMQQSLLSVSTQRMSDAVKEGEGGIAQIERSTEREGNSRGALPEEAVGGGTVQYRFYLWDKSLGAFLSRPVTGIGSGGFGRHIAELPQVFDVQLNRSDKNTPISSHNTVLGIMAETGLVGLTGYILWTLSLLAVIIRIFRKHGQDRFAVACSMMMCIFLFSDLWSQNSFFPTVTFLAAFMLGALRGEPSENPAVS